MAVSFKGVRRLQGQRVRMLFEDGREVVALLLCATKDIDGSKHLIYGSVEPDNGGETSVAVDAKTLVSIQLADSDKAFRPVHGWDYIDIRRSA
jgi:hypothetical protein